MDCCEARKQIIESLAERLPGARTADLEGHLAGCETCRGFSETQLKLDLQLSIAISAPPLNPGFRQSLMEKIRRQPPSLWPEFLPDAAHLVGCICATALCVPILPFPTGPIVLAGLAFTLVTYLVQSVIQGSLEACEEDRP